MDYFAVLVSFLYNSKAFTPPKTKPEPKKNTKNKVGVIFLFDF
jgi:hypothetical protein